MMELNTDVKQSWIWEQKDLNLILQIHQNLLILTYTVSLLLLSKPYNSVYIFWMAFSGALGEILNVRPPPPRNNSENANFSNIYYNIT